MGEFSSVVLVVLCMVMVVYLVSNWLISVVGIINVYFSVGSWKLVGGWVFFDGEL